MSLRVGTVEVGARSAVGSGLGEGGGAAVRTRRRELWWLHVAVLPCLPCPPVSPPCWCCSLGMPSWLPESPFPRLPPGDPAEAGGLGPQPPPGTLGSAKPLTTRPFAFCFWTCVAGAAEPRTSSVCRAHPRSGPGGRVAGCTPRRCLAPTLPECA